MESVSLLVVRLGGSQFAFESTSVSLIAPLSELQHVEQTARHVVGVANLRGVVVPVIDLNLKLGYPKQSYALSDCLVFLELGEKKVGIIVNEALNVIEVGPHEILSTSMLEDVGEATCPHPSTNLIQGFLQSGPDVVMVLNLDNLVQIGFKPTDPNFEESELIPPSPGLFSPDSSLEDRTQFRDRSLSLTKPIDTEEQDGWISIAVVRLGPEYFGFELPTIQEFAELQSVTPVPCCPPHIVGQMNLRGNLITVIDISEALGLQRVPPPETRKVVVLNDQRLFVGVVVDDLVDVLRLDQPDLHLISNSTQKADALHFRGTTTFDSKICCLIDLSVLVTKGGLAVNEVPS